MNEACNKVSFQHTSHTTSSTPTRTFRHMDTHTHQKHTTSHLWRTHTKNSSMKQLGRSEEDCCVTQQPLLWWVRRIYGRQDTLTSGEETNSVPVLCQSSHYNASSFTLQSCALPPLPALHVYGHISLMIMKSGSVMTH